MKLHHGVPLGGRVSGAPVSIRVGDCLISVLNVGHVTLKLADDMNVPLDAAPPREEFRALAAQREIPLQCVLIQTPGTALLVDAGVYEIAPDSVYAIPGYLPPPGLGPSLEALGVAFEDVSHVVITHRHWDHYNGTTRLDRGERVPCFPRARHHIGRADWERAQSAVATEGSLDQRTLAVLHRQGLLEFVDQARELAPEIRILPAPGETPGHQVVRVHSRGETLYAIGDLYHHPVEFIHPEWMVSWADAEANLASRRRLLSDAVPERAWLVAAHIPGIGRLSADGSYDSVIVPDAMRPELPERRMRLLCFLALLVALIAGHTLLSSSSAQMAPPAALGAGPPPIGAPVFPDTMAAARDSLMREVLRTIAGRESAPAESVFKNIRVLKGMQAGRMLRVMNFGFGKSLGVGCLHCHAAEGWEKEDRHTKQIAREMWTMVGAINRDHLPKIANLRGEPATVNCTTCHRGTTRPALAMP